jgi:hypothetical protein
MLAESEYKVPQTLFEVQQILYDKAFRQLRNGLTEGGLGGEGYALLAAGYTEEHEKALKRGQGKWRGYVCPALGAVSSRPSGPRG